MINEALRQRRRVRTPGKHIVLFGLAVTFMLALSAAVLNTAPVQIPDFKAPSFSGQEGGPLFAPPEDFITDLSMGDDGRAGMVKLTVRVEAANPEDLRLIERERSAIRERVGFFLRELEPADLEGSAAMARVKNELLKRVNLAIEPVEASGVVIEDVIVQ